MKLSKYQKKIIDQIITGKVFDIPSYLKSFCKGKDQKYDIEELQNRFREEEREKIYKVMKDGHSAYTPSSGASSMLDFRVPRKPDSITDDEWEEKPAELDENIPFQEELFAGQTYSFDFKDKGVFVADSFESVVDFIMLWTYLENEALVLSVDKPILAEDIGVFFESNNVESPIEKEKRLESQYENEEAVQLSCIFDFFQSDFQNPRP
jgi:hypothetical protein